MSTAFAPPSASGLRRQSRRSWWFLYGGVLFASLVLAVMAGAGAGASAGFWLALLLLVCGLAFVVVNPVGGLYLTAVLALLGDPGIVPWYPFTKNLSSAESILYLGNQFSFNPLELYIGGLCVGWFLKMLNTRQWTFRKGQLFAPVMAFSGFVLLGLLYGLARGGDRQSAIWEVRPLLYLPIFYVLFTNLFQRQRQYRILYVLIMIAVVVNSVVALVHYQSLASAQRESLESLVVHTATLPMNALVILVIASWMFKSSSQFRRYALPVLAIPVVYVYLISERRAAFVALVGALGLVAIVLFWTNRRAFWTVIPALLIVGTVYTGAFWNDSTSIVGFPAQAIKTVIAPDSLSEKDQSSDLYRIYEKADVIATIRSNRIFGVGFGHPFLRPVPLPTISSFPLADYMPHNSFLWVWMKVGAGGFIALLFLLGRTMMIGAKTMRQNPRGDRAVLTLTSTAFVIMYVMYSYVDLAWDLQTMVFLAMAFAFIGSASDLEPEEPPAVAPRAAVPAPLPV